jgi:hypothetical protein
LVRWVWCGVCGVIGVVWCDGWWELGVIYIYIFYGTVVKCCKGLRFTHSLRSSNM